jgi:phytoene dehydrogenase-like protein
MAQSFDVIIIGAGHNGLTAACRLAKAGRRVLVLERRPVVGGACVTEELFPGFKVSTAAYVNGLFRPEILRELRLADYGVEMLLRNPSSFTPFPDGRSLLLGPDVALNHREVSKFSPRDAERLADYDAMIERVASVLEPVLLSVPPKAPDPSAPADPLSPILSRLGRLEPSVFGEVMAVLTGSARDLLDRFFESDELKATLATDGVIGTFAPPSAPGTAYVLFHHVMGETFGNRGIWSYIRGGMGTLTQALARAAADLGAVVRTDAEVAGILVRDGAAVGVALADGTEFRAPVVASNATAEVTFRKLLDPAALPADFADMVARIDYRSASLKINAALSELPDFKCLPGRPGPQHRGTFHICPTTEYIERAYDDAKYGRPSGSPIIEGALPTAVDPTLAPPGKHVLSLFVQYAPYALRDGVWDDAARNAFADRVFDILEDYAPGIKASVIDRRIYAPPDIERVFNLTGGNIFQGAVSPTQFWAWRPVPGFGDHRSPIRGLYLCGSAANPGGGVMGAAGWNAAAVMLADAAPSARG